MTRSDSMTSGPGFQMSLAYYGVMLLGIPLQGSLTLLTSGSGQAGEEKKHDTPSVFL